MTRSTAWYLFFGGLAVCVLINGLLGIILIAVAIVMELVIMSQTRTHNKLPPLPAASHSSFDKRSPSSTGKWLVHGVDRESRMETSGYYFASTEENAKVKAELDGMVVTRIEEA